MKRATIMLPVVIFLWFCGSNKNDWRTEFQKLSADSIYNNNHDGWAFSTKEEYPSFVIYNLRKEDGDTLKVFSFLKNDLRVRSSEYFKVYPTHAGDTCYLKMISSDTLYFYKQNRLKTFVVGEYGYRFESLLLNDDELDYYLEHKDSLCKVRGTNLPKLPSKQ